ncbi:DUF4276 family protein [Propionibacterium australiense]|uniref:DUF4276 family protein n=1 Tax=Propionibacterium australiense TaxID=119981 RepID=A0A383S712_9ACTN|nr:DUF4276 family protein [Propionibacterium australiense]RLP07128.1 DUF4276 family protein [Propionibacterium australiense]RLP07896.1 DUF4276 family protein [Propionibacterium australiense]SYZ33768.1 Protein of unknown function DUF4276 [Propionibacterium australiense]VEH88745.1 Uncharacterised protein [Propionibacterium australiense]
MNKDDRRVIVLVEGPTERTLADRVLTPAALKQDIFLKAVTVKTSSTPSGSHSGGGTWTNYQKALTGFFKDRNLRRIGLLIDYYQYPRGAPGRDAAGNGITRQSELVNALRAQYQDDRFCPLVVLHEIEALVLAAIDAGHGDGVIPRRELAALRRAIVAAGGPEFVNNGTETAPSKRLKKAAPNYSKTVTGPDLVAEAGLDAILERCPTFASWWRDILS